MNKFIHSFYDQPWTLILRPSVWKLYIRCLLKVNLSDSKPSVGRVFRRRKNLFHCSICLLRFCLFQCLSYVDFSALFAIRSLLPMLTWTSWLSRLTLNSWSSFVFFPNEIAGVIIPASWTGFLILWSYTSEKNFYVVHEHRFLFVLSYQSAFE